MNITDVLTGAPKWVWVLFILLISRGLSALNDREMKVSRLFLLPLVFLFWGFYSVAMDISLPLHGLTSMLFGLVLGAAFGWVLWKNTPRLKRKQGSYLVIRSGSPLTFIFIMITFVSKFTLMCFLALQPDLKFDAGFNMLFGLLSGIVDGVFWGGTLNLYLTSNLNAKPDNHE